VRSTTITKQYISVQTRAQIQKVVPVSKKLLQSRMRRRGLLPGMRFAREMATDLSTPSSQQDISQHARDVESLDSLLDSLLDELAYQHALRQCDDMINYFTGRGPLAKMQNVRDLEMMEYMVLHPLADFTPEERRQIESLSEPERTERIEGIRRIHISGRDAFLDALYNFFGDVDADYEYIRRGGHMLTP